MVISFHSIVLVSRHSRSSCTSNGGQALEDLFDRPVSLIETPVQRMSSEGNEDRVAILQLVRFLSLVDRFIVNHIAVIFRLRESVEKTVFSA